MPTNPYKNTDQVNAVIKVRRGPEVDREQVVYEDGELIYSTDKKRLFVGDGVGDDGTDGGNIVGNKLWISDSFNSANLPYIQKYDLVYRPSTTGFYILTGDSVVDPKSYLLVGGKELIPQIATYTIPKATNSTLGGVIVKAGLSVDVNGNLNVDYDPNTLTLVGNKLSVIPGVGGTSTGTIGNASYAAYGKVRIVENSGLIIDSGNLSVSIDNRTIKLSSIAGVDKLYVDSSEIEITNIPTATTTNLGGIIVSDGLKIDGSGNLSLKTATNLFIGGVKTGKALSASYSTSELDVISDNNTIVVNGLNQLEVNYPIANDKDVLTYDGTTNKWIAASNSNSGSFLTKGFDIYPTAGTFTWTAPAGVTRVMVALVAGGGGGGSTGAAGNGGNTVCSIGGITVTATGGLGGGGNVGGATGGAGGAGGTVAAVAEDLSKNFAGFGAGNGGNGGTYGVGGTGRGSAGGSSYGGAAQTGTANPMVHVAGVRGTGLGGAHGGGGGSGSPGGGGTPTTGIGHGGLPVCNEVSCGDGGGDTAFGAGFVPQLASITSSFIRYTSAGDGGLGNWGCGGGGGGAVYFIDVIPSTAYSFTVGAGGTGGSGGGASGNLGLLAVIY